MLKIRMQRSGRINQPSFRIVVTEHTSSPKAGKYVERVGFYNPRSKERTLVESRIKYWMSVGARPSDTVHNMLVSAGILNSKKINVLPKKTVAKKATDTDLPAEASAQVGSSSEPKKEEQAPTASAESSGELEETVELLAADAPAKTANEETPAVGE